MKEKSVRALDAVVFDLDDTIYPHWYFVAEACRDAAYRFEAATGKPHRWFLSRALHRFWRNGPQDNTIFSDLVKQAKCKKRGIVEELVTAFRNHKPLLIPHDDVVEGLRMLRKKDIKLGLLTDGHAKTQKRKIAALGIGDLFDVIKISGELPGNVGKPDGRVFKAMLRALGVHPCSACHIGDDPVRDIGGAIAAGMRAVRVRQGFHRHKNGPHPEREFHSTSEAIEYVGGTKT